MRLEFVLDLAAPDDRYARRICPWATRVVKVEAGYLCFESETDYLLWKHQR
jgi:hypothetical protein